MPKHLTFKIKEKIIAVPYSSSYQLQPTLINKSFIEENAEYINYKREKIKVIDTEYMLFGEYMKRFDGLLFIIKNEQKIALKTESFFKDDKKFDIVLDVDTLFV